MTNPSSEDQSKAWRRLNAVALVVQAEAVILLLSPAIALLVREGVQDPRPALSCLAIAPLLWRLGYGVANASRVAIGIMAALVGLHIIDILGPKIRPLDAITVTVEVIATIVAIATIHQYKPPRVDGWNRQLRWQTVVPIALAVIWQILVTAWISTGLAQDRTSQYRIAVQVLAALLIGTAIWLVVSSGYLVRLSRLGSVLSPRSSPIDLGRRAINRIRAPRLNLALVLIVGGVSWATLALFAWLIRRPETVLRPVVLLIPLVALVALVLCLLWLLVAWAQYTRRAFAGPTRPVAIGTSAALAVMLALASYATLYLFGDRP